VTKQVTATATEVLASPVDQLSPAGAGDFWSLMKPRVMSLVVFTGMVGLLLAPGTLHPLLAFTAILCIAIGAGASAALNMWYDADIDARMERTANRPIPAGRMERGEALGFGLTLGVAAVTIMGLAINLVAGFLLALTILYYTVFYTMWLKRATPQNIVIGGAAGAFPPVIGWAAVTGTLSLEPLVLFAIIFMWTPPHFWALSLFCRDDYKNAGVPMLPVVAGDAETKKQIIIYSLLLAPLGVLPWVLGFGGLVYGVVAMVLGTIFVALAVSLLNDYEHRRARRLFAFSIFYLFALFAVLGTEALLRGTL
jgi:heme o synthase